MIAFIEASFGEFDPPEINWLHEIAKKNTDEYWLENDALDGIVESSFGDTRSL
ncbi:hypothetical protein JCM30471_31980 [Desulfuromonas carbonis]